MNGAGCRTMAQGWPSQREVAAAGQHPAQDDRGLARQHEAEEHRGLAEDERPDHGVGDPSAEVGQPVTIEFTGRPFPCRACVWPDDFNESAHVERGSSGIVVL